MPQFCGPFKILKRISKVTYKLDFPSTSKIHLIFHVSNLRKRNFNEDNVVDEGILVEFTKPLSQPHEPEKILDCHELPTCHHVCCAKFWSSGKIDLTKGPLGKTLVLYVRRFLLLFSRMKTLHKGGSNVKTTILESSTLT